MKKIIYICILAFYFSIVSFDSSIEIIPIEKALNYQENCNNQIVSIFFINGILESKRLANERLLKVKSSLEGYLKEQNIIAKFYLSYNEPKESFNVFKQLEQQAKLDINSNLVNNAKDFFKTYLKHILSGRKVILIAYSQGNIYANVVYKALKNHNNQNYTRHLNIVGIAPPTNSIGNINNHYPYIRTKQDITINCLESFIKQQYFLFFCNRFIGNVYMRLISLFNKNIELVNLNKLEPPLPPNIEPLKLTKHNKLQKLSAFEKLLLSLNGHDLYNGYLKYKNIEQSFQKYVLEQINNTISYCKE